nr:hypothetical protein [Grifola frondosa]
MLEQALIYYYQPELNYLKLVKLGFHSFTRERTNHLSRYKVDILVNNSKGEFISSFTSINSASIGLGISRTTLTRYINTDHLVYSQKYNISVSLTSSLEINNLLPASWLRLVRLQTKIRSINRESLPKTLVTAKETKKLYILIILTLNKYRIN